MTIIQFFSFNVQLINVPDVIILDNRLQCCISCGAEYVIENVLPIFFCLPVLCVPTSTSHNEEDSDSSNSDDDDDDDDDDELDNDGSNSDEDDDNNDDGWEGNEW
jgi:hypothetical protein